MTIKSMAKIYTKTGDDGTTALFNGTRVPKHHTRVKLYGDVDELNASLGIAISFVKDKSFRIALTTLQKDLFAFGAKLANPKEKKHPPKASQPSSEKKKTDFNEKKILNLEKAIDKMENFLEPMKSFILPGGTPSSALLHHARTICRRTERKLTALSEKETIDSLYIKYLNRLSDYLFVAARFANHLEKTPDVPW